MQCFRLSAQHDNLSAIFALGYFYYEGRIVDNSNERAFEYFHLLFEKTNYTVTDTKRYTKDDAILAEYISQCYRKGLGVEISALMWCEIGGKACELNK